MLKGGHTLKRLSEEQCLNTVWATQREDFDHLANGEQTKTKSDLEVRETGKKNNSK